MNRPPVIPTVLTVIGVIILCALGTWQAYRLQWKTDLIAGLAAAEADVALEAVLRDDPPATMMRGALRGVLLSERTFFVKPRTYEGVVGYHVLTPLWSNAAGGTILINRGWMAQDAEWSNEQPSPQEVSFDGVLAPFPKRGAMALENNPAAGEWYRLDLDEIAETYALPNLLPYVLYRDGADDSVPRAISHLIVPRNNHMQYMIFWFTMALVFISIFILRFCCVPSRTECVVDENENP